MLVVFRRIGLRHIRGLSGFPAVELGMSRAGTAKFLNVQKCQIRKGPVTVRLA